MKKGRKGEKGGGGGSYRYPSPTAKQSHHGEQAAHGCGNCAWAGGPRRPRRHRPPHGPHRPRPRCRPAIVSGDGVAVNVRATVRATVTVAVARSADGGEQQDAAATRGNGARPGGAATRPGGAATRPGGAARQAQGGPVVTARGCGDLATRRQSGVVAAAIQAPPPRVRRPHPRQNDCCHGRRHARGACCG